MAEGRDRGRFRGRADPGAGAVPADGGRFLVMKVDAATGPATRSWVAAIHASEDDATPIGSGVVVDTRRVLTSAHVAKRGDAVRQPLWVAFPLSEGDRTVRRRVAQVRLPESSELEVADAAMLVLAEGVPAGVRPAPLRCPDFEDLDEPAGYTWWAHGFADGDPLGRSTHGTLVAPRWWLWSDARAPYRLGPGFSGTGLWSPEYQAVIGLVCQADDLGDGQVIPLFHVDRCLPGERLLELAAWSAEQADEAALAAWGWEPGTGPAGARHRRPRARDAIGGGRGHRFRGRTAALIAIRDRLDADGVERRALVVTGDPGAGKSAVLGRIVTTADPALRRRLPPDDEAVRASAGSVACAVHGRGKTALEVATEIARAASAPLPETVDHLAPAMRRTLSERTGGPFSVVIDAVDETAGPAEARSVISDIVLPLVETCAEVGARVVVGTRRRDGEGDLLAEFAGRCQIIDLDDPGCFALSDLTAYALATLRLGGDERPGNPYADDAVARPVARRIAELSGRNFLVAGLIARAHGLHDHTAVDPDDLSFTPTVDGALREYLARLPQVAGLPAQSVLTALAFAEPPGFTPRLWRTAIAALGAGVVAERELLEFARSSAAALLVESAESAESAESGGQDSAPVFRLCHQALNDALLRRREQRAPRPSDEAALTRAFKRLGAEHGWRDAPAYLFCSLPVHATRAAMIDTLLRDDDYLLHADLRRLLLFSGGAVTPAGRARDRLLRLTPQAATADPVTRAAQFTITEALHDLGDGFRGTTRPIPYRAEWAATDRPRIERMVLEGHTAWVSSVCAFALEGHTLLATASAAPDGTVRIWDARTGRQWRVLDDLFGGVNAVCAFTLDGRTLLATGDDETVRIWDPRTGRQLRTLDGHTSWVDAVCAFTLDGRTLLATAGSDHTVRIWDPHTGEQHHVLDGHTDGVNAVCAFTLEGHTLLATAGNDHTVRIWDPRTGEQLRIIEGHTGYVEAVCAFTLDGHPLLATAAWDGTVRIWDPRTGEQHRVLDGHTDFVYAVCAFTLDGHTLLATAGGDHTVRIWDPRTGRQRGVLEGHTSDLTAVCAFTLDGHTLLATAAWDETVRIWDPRTGHPHRPLEGRHTSGVNAVRAFTLDGEALLVTGDGDHTVRVWDAGTGRQRRIIEGHIGYVEAVCAFTLDDEPLLATGAYDQTVRVWDPRTGRHRRTIRVLPGDLGGVNAICAFTLDGRTLLATAADEETVRIWDPRTGEQRRTLEGHTSWVREVSAFTLDGVTLLATGADDQTFRIWDPRTGRQHRAVKAVESDIGGVNAICPFTLDGRTLLATGADDRAVRFWDPRTCEQRRVLGGHTGAVLAICAFTFGGRTLLATAADEQAVRIWEPVTGSCLAVVGLPRKPSAVAWDGERLAIGMPSGLLTIRPLPPLLAA